MPLKRSHIQISEGILAVSSKKQREPNEKLKFSIVKLIARNKEVFRVRVYVCECVFFCGFMIYVGIKCDLFTRECTMDCFFYVADQFTKLSEMFNP